MSLNPSEANQTELCGFSHWVRLNSVKTTSPAAAFGAAFGASFGLGLPSGPTSVAACATTSGAGCACDEEAAKCIAIRAVVASSTRRRFVMMVWVPGEFLTTRSGNKVWRSTNKH